MALIVKQKGIVILKDGVHGELCDPGFSSLEEEEASSKCGFGSHPVIQEASMLE